MNVPVTVALDVMGGDHGAAAIIEGANLIMKDYRVVTFLMVGDEAVIHPLLEIYPALKPKTTIIHTDEMIADDEKPSIALRRGRKSSMRLAIRAVKEGQAAGIVSAGNTGAMMAISKLVLQTLPGIDRPAIAGVMPSLKHDNIMLDLGANIHCDASNLFEFAAMGDAFARALLGRENPTIGLLNVGSEDIKGPEAVQNAAAMLQEEDCPINFHGFIEGNDITRGIVDVIVTDGFTGNIALKTIEGTAGMFAGFLKEGLKTAPIWVRMGALIAKQGLENVKRRIDPREYNGAMFIGLNGIVVKSHGGSDAYGHACAIEKAVRLAQFDINRKIIEELAATSYPGFDLEDALGETELLPKGLDQDE